MKMQGRRKLFFFAGVILMILAVVTMIGTGMRREMLRIRQREAENTLFYYNEKSCCSFRVR